MLYSHIANGSYVNEHRHILKDLRIWKNMTEEEKNFFRPCHNCTKYSEYAEDKENNTCPCFTCEHRKTEIQVDNRMTTLRRKYF